jgi:hypothetical protein
VIKSISYLKQFFLISIMLNAIINQNAADCDGKGIWYPFWEKEIAWIIVIAVALIVSITFLSNAVIAKKHNAVSQQKVFIGFGLFGAGLAIIRVLFIFSDIERWNNCLTPKYIQLVLLSYSIGVFSALVLMAVVERDLLQMQKMYMSKAYLIMAIATLILVFVANSINQTYLDVIRLFNTIVSVFGSIVLMGLFLKIVKDSTGTIRKNGILNFGGIMLVFIGVMLDSDLIIRALKIPIWLPAIFPIAGFILLLYTQLWSVKTNYGE